MTVKVVKNGVTKKGNLTHLAFSKTDKFVQYCKDKGLEPTRTRAKKLRRRGIL